MTTLHLLRHAKSSWKDTSLADADRPLNSRGRKAVTALRKHFADLELIVDVVLVSPAQRTRETWAGVADAFRDDPPVRFEAAIYQADGPDLLTLVRGVGHDNASVLLIGHNPAVEQLTLSLAGTGDPKALADMQRGYPTGGFVTLTFDKPWSRVGPGDGHVVRFVRPRSLAG